MDEAPLNMWMEDKYIAEAEAQDVDVWIQLAAAGPGNPADGTGGIFFFFFPSSHCWPVSNLLGSR